MKAPLFYHQSTIYKKKASQFKNTLRNFTPAFNNQVLLEILV